MISMLKNLALFYQIMYFFKGKKERSGLFKGSFNKKSPSSNELTAWTFFTQNYNL